MSVILPDIILARESALRLFNKITLRVDRCSDAKMIFAKIFRKWELLKPHLGPPLNEM